MKDHPSPHASHARQQGFSIVEMLVVVLIIGLVTAMAVPMIASYMRSQRIRAVTKEVTGQLQDARMKAIMKNVNIGVVWLAWSNSAIDHESTWAVEDDLQPAVAPDWSVVGAEDLGAVLANTVQRAPAIARLPDGVQFVDPGGANGCVGGTAQNAWGIRFTRLGGICRVGTANCPAPGGAALPTQTTTPYVGFNANNDATLCVRDARTGLKRLITVTAGGRIFVRDGQS